MQLDTKQWLEIAQADYDDSLYLFHSARHPNALYLMCQAIEKILKAAQVEFKREMPKKIHKLKDLATATGLPFTEEQYQFLTELTKDYERVRYRDYQQNLYNTKAKVKLFINQGKEIYQWILAKLNNH